MWFLQPRNSGKTARILADFCGLFLICAGSLCGVSIGSCLLGSMGSVLGLMAGALWGFYMAEAFASLLKVWENVNTEALEQSHTTLVARSEKILSSGSRWPRLSRIFARKPARLSPPDSYDAYTLEDIHRRLKEINAELWHHLRTGVFSSCHAGLYSVKLNNSEESLDWRQVNRRTVAALNRFETATTDKERSASLNEALDRIGQKVQLVQKAALRKADRLNFEEAQEIQKNEAELWRLSRLDRLSLP
jgi:hypothetical protein